MVSVVSNKYIVTLDCLCHLSNLPPMVPFGIHSFINFPIHTSKDFSYGMVSLGDQEGSPAMVPTCTTASGSHILKISSHSKQLHIESC